MIEQGCPVFDNSYFPVAQQLMLLLLWDETPLCTEIFVFVQHHSEAWDKLSDCDRTAVEVLMKPLSLSWRRPTRLFDHGGEDLHVKKHTRELNKYKFI